MLHKPPDKNSKTAITPIVFSTASEKLRHKIGNLPLSKSVVRYKNCQFSFASYWRSNEVNVVYNILKGERKNREQVV